MYMYLGHMQHPGQQVAELPPAEAVAGAVGLHL